ncbi:Hypothetical protein KVN_LOCUS319 [uncultured virus]|nr:Hypothetical protein KVN_LOCUS319 [uncultured virus]
MENNYMQYVMTNYPLENDSIESFESDNSQSGGRDNSDIVNEPNAGFPPIYICDKNTTELFINSAEPIKREYSTHKTSVSIKDIMEKRRNVTPFLSLSS